MRSRILLTGGVLAGWLALLAPASACKVPVFRYALERWRADAYEVVVYHRGPLPADAAKTLADLRAAAEGRALANLEVAVVDLAEQPEAGYLKLWNAEQVRPLPLLGPLAFPGSVIGSVVPTPKPLPWVVVRYPGQLRLAGAVWSGPLTADIVATLTESPARKEIARRLLAGDSVVWLLLAGGDPAKDDAAEKLLKAELARLEGTIKLPDDEEPGQPVVPLLSALPLRVKFSVLRIARSDPAEGMLRAMLLGAHDEAPRVRGEPILFPVFGRGRALDAFVGKEINAEVVGDVAAFLCGACSCTVKQLNPGVDLLFATDWDKALETTGRAEVEQPRSSPGDPVAIPQPSKQVVEAKPPAAPEPPPPPAPSANYVWLGGGMFIGLLVVTGLLAIGKNRKRPDEPLP